MGLTSLPFVFAISWTIVMASSILPLVISHLGDSLTNHGATKIRAVWQNNIWWNIFQSPTAFKIQGWIQPPSDMAIAKLKFPTSALFSLDTYSNAEKKINIKFSRSLFLQLEQILQLYFLFVIGIFQQKQLWKFRTAPKYQNSLRIFR